jgi:superfamily I DNA/RNA helicase/PHP family Zn ribbon phosphoesterase
VSYIADLHVHSAFSRATSPRLVPCWLDLWARRKGIALLGTGDISHPGWLSRLRAELAEAPEEGFYLLGPEAARAFDGGEGRGEWRPSHDAPFSPAAPRFVLTGEISTIYKASGATRKVHHVVIVSSFAAAEAFQRRLARVGNIGSDGRPILGLDSRDLFELLLESDDRAILIPAHIWTPWFSALGDKSGFDSIAECYRDLSPRIGAVETGLSSNPPMNWAVSSLDPYLLVSNSDAHSPENLGREATIIEGEFSYPGLLSALAPASPNASGSHDASLPPLARVAGTVEFFPEEGKYHYDGHRACKLVLGPAASREVHETCPVCGRPLTVGVLHRVLELADRPLVESLPWSPDFAATRRRPYHSLVPLRELLGEIVSVGPNSRKVDAAYSSLVANCGGELSILMDVEPAVAGRAAGGLLPAGLLEEAISRMRAGRVFLEPGYDGEYGVVRVFAPGELARGGLSRGGGLFSLPFEPPPGPAPAARNHANPGIAAAPPSPKPPFGFASPNPASFPAPQDAATRPALSPEQEAAASSGIARSAHPVAANAVLVVAGPGSGKTTLLVERIARLVESGAAPASILAITFTAKAAGELRERLSRRLGSGPGPDADPSAPSSLPEALTFHALALKLEAGKPGPGAQPLLILDPREREELLSRACSSSGLAAPRAKRLGLYVESRKRLLLLPGEEARAGLPILPGLPPHDEDALCDPEFDAAYRAYERSLALSGVADFDGLLLGLVRRLASSPADLSDLRREYPFVLVDEYQDVNYAQYALIRLLAPGGGLPAPFAIGDPDQAIYGFRGADPRYISRFLADYPDASLFRLARSWRCAPALLEASGRVVGRSSPGAASGPVPLEPAGPVSIIRSESPSADSEAEWLARCIEALLGGTSLFSRDSGVVGPGDASEAAPEDIAILLRAGGLAPPIEAALRNHGIPFESVGDLPWWALEPASSAIALLRAALDPRRLVLLPSGLSSQALALGTRLAAKAEASRAGAMASLDARDAIEAVLALLPADAAHAAELRDSFSDLAAASPGLDLGAFLSLLSGDLPQDALLPKPRRVRIMTMHASKGLEFPYVFLPCLEEGLVPFTLFDVRSGAGESSKAARLAEESRILYVAMTRARTRLYLSSSRHRDFMGRELSLGPSSFLGRIGGDLAEFVEASPPARPRDMQLTLF